MVSFNILLNVKKLLPKPVTFTFENEAEGDAYIAELEGLLDKVVLPVEPLERGKIIKLHTSIKDYIRTVNITDDDRRILETHPKLIADIDVAKITYKWTEAWVRELKHNRKLAPGTITKHVGTLARCLCNGQVLMK
jgi:hypothetical protein